MPEKKKWGDAVRHAQRYWQSRVLLLTTTMIMMVMMLAHACPLRWLDRCCVLEDVFHAGFWSRLYLLFICRRAGDGPTDFY